MPFVKLDCGILNSTIWDDRDARDVFITALLMAEPHELREPMAQIEVDSMELTGWDVPVGWYGFVRAAGAGIVRQALVPREVGVACLKRLGSPEAESRSKAHEGRRMVRVDGGYIVLNFMRYRDKDHTSAERSKRYRDRKKAQELAAVTRDGHDERRDITQADADDADAQSEVIPPTEEEASAGAGHVLGHSAVPPSPDDDMPSDVYYRHCTMALNEAMAENPTLEGGWIPVTSSSQIGRVTWMEDGIPLEVASTTIRERAQAYRSTPQQRGPRSLKYFDAPVREQWERGRMTAAEDRVNKAFEK